VTPVTPVTPDALPVSWADVQDAARVLHGVAHRTPVLTSRTVDARTGAQLFFKCENFQRTGAFKFRGAYNALSRLSGDQRLAGVVTYSSGNHAQAVALSAALLTMKATIVMPDDAPSVKVEATRGYGAEVLLYDRQTTTREAVADAIVARTGAVLIPPFDHPHVIAGQGTAAKELLEETGPLDHLYVCVGGGGLIGGCALAARALAPRCRVVGVEPALGDDATRSFHTGVLHRVHNPPTIADGARTTSLGVLTFPLLRACVDDMITVTDEELIAAMRYVWERLKIVVEPTGALAIAGVFQQADRLRGQRVGVLISGGNVDLAAVLPLMSSKQE